jgi:hypothetical protein
MGKECGEEALQKPEGTIIRTVGSSGNDSAGRLQGSNCTRGTPLFH